MSRYTGRRKRLGTAARIVLAMILAAAIVGAVGLLTVSVRGLVL